jgi:CheY-like chemotaxis protein
MVKQMFKNKRLLAISELKLVGRIEQMSEEQLNKYAQALESFVEDFPINEKRLKIALEARDYDSVAKHLAAIGDMLEKIYADDMASECQRQIIGLKNAKHGKIEAFATYFLKLISMLSIDIQMAGYNGAENMPVVDDTGMSERISILAVDDTEFFLRTLRSLLQDNAHYKLTCTTSGTAALKFLQKNHPNLFILDIDMPDMDGYELAQKIRAIGQTAPIIFLTGNSTRESVEKALKVGAADFIVKPISRAQVLERITKFA